MVFSVYADLARCLTDAERGALFEALDQLVPGSGCVGIQNGPTDEVYFCVEARSKQAAHDLATRYLVMMLDDAELDVAYTLCLQPATA